MAANTLCLMILVSFVIVVSCSEFLMLLPVGSKSHYTLFEHVAKSLVAKKEHKVTMYSLYTVDNPPPRVKQYNLMEGRPPAIGDDWLKQIFQPKSIVTSFVGFRGMFNQGCEDMYSNPEIKILIEEVKTKGPLYDVAFVNGFFSECSLPLASIAAKHVALIVTIPLPHWVAMNFNIPAPTSTVPTVFAEYVPPMNFYERAMNTIEGYFVYGFYKLLVIPDMQAVAEKHLPTEAPTIMEAMKNVSLILSNADPVYTVPRPIMPFIIDIGGIHLKKSKPLPKEFEDFIQSSGEHGVVVFGLGSVVQAKFLPKEIRDAFIAALSKLKQKVIWKFEEQIEGLPANIKIVKWMPQQDLLGHPKVRLFITHAGRFSLQEAAYHGVPVIGIPLFGDQPHNINLAKSLGFAEQISITNITADWFYTLIMKVLTDKSYSEKAKEASAILKDRLTTPSERAVYWTEYVIRHNGAHHLKNKGAQEQCFVQTLLLDVFAVMGLIATAVIAISISIIVFLFRFISRKFLKKTKQKKN